MYDLSYIHLNGIMYYYAVDTMSSTVPSIILASHHKTATYINRFKKSCHSMDECQMFLFSSFLDFNMILKYYCHVLKLRVQVLTTDIVVMLCYVMFT